MANHYTTTQDNSWFLFMEGWSWQVIAHDRPETGDIHSVQACIQEEGHNMFIFKPSLAECQGRWRDIPWHVHKSFIQVFVVFIALSEHSS